MLEHTLCSPLHTDSASTLAVDDEALDSSAGGLPVNLLGRTSAWNALTLIEGCRMLVCVSNGWGYDEVLVSSTVTAAVSSAVQCKFGSEQESAVSGIMWRIRPAG